MEISTPPEAAPTLEATAPPFQIRRLGLLHSAGVRFAAIYAVLLSLSVGALALFLWWETAGLLNRQTDAAIATDAQSLAEHWEMGGLRALAQTIEDRLSPERRRRRHLPAHRPVVAADRRQSRRHGRRVATETDVEYEIPVERGSMRSLAKVQRFDLEGGFHLLVGRDVQVRARLSTLLTSALLWASAGGGRDGQHRRLYRARPVPPHFGQRVRHRQRDRRR